MGHLINANDYTLSQCDSYYRNYRLSKTNIGRVTETVKIYAMGDGTLLSMVPTEEEAKKIIDDWLYAR